MLNDFSQALSVQFFGVEYRTIALSLLIIAAAILFKSVITDLIFAALRRLMLRQEKPWHDKLLASIEQPVAAFFLILGLAIALDLLPLPDPWHGHVGLLFRILVTITVVWGLIRSTGAAAEIVAQHGRAKGLAVATFVPLFRQIVVILLVIIGIVMIMETLGLSVSSIIATLGIGGAALAFASQSTIANLYGSIAIALDRPFKVGDRVKIGTIEGAVESIGLRSTQIRTLTKTLVSIPNNTIANEAIDNYTLISARRILFTIGLTYSTTRAQIEAIIADTKTLLKEMKKDIAPDMQRVNLVAFADSSINLEVLCFTTSGDTNHFLDARQEVLLRVMDIVAKNGARMAFPTRTVHLVKDA